MTATVEFHHDFPFDTDRFVDIYFSPDYEHRAASSGEYAVYRVESLERGESLIRRTLVLAPNGRTPPKWLARVAGTDERPSIREHTEYRRDDGDFALRLVPSVMSDRIRIGGSMHLISREDCGCRRYAQLRVDVSVFGVGGRIESYLAQTLRDQFDMRQRVMLEHYAGSTDTIGVPRVG